MATDDRSPAELAERVIELLSQATAADVRARVAIGAILDGHPRALAEVADRVELGARTLRHCVEVHQRIPVAELEGYLSGPRVPPWSAIVILGRVTPRKRRSAVMADWLARDGSVRALLRATRA